MASAYTCNITFIYNYANVCVCMYVSHRQMESLRDPVILFFAWTATRLHVKT